MIFTSGFLRTHDKNTTSLYAKEISATMTELVQSDTIARNPEGSALILLNALDLVTKMVLLPPVLRCFPVLN